MSVTCISLNEVNNLASDLFIKIFGNVVEHYPAAAIGILKNRPFKDVEDISLAVNGYIDSLNSAEKEKILLLHPDLAGRLADLGKLTNESSEEQKSAGLDKLISEAKQKLNELNEKYKEKFGFPFVTCARQNNTETILAGLETRLLNDRETELKTGIEEVKKISKLRIIKIVTG